jgi:hypothetical protein
VATTETRVERAITGKRSVRCKRRVNDRSLHRSPSAELPAIEALVRLLARQSAREWLTTAAFEEPTEVGNEAEAGATQSAGRG